MLKKYRVLHLLNDFSGGIFTIVMLLKNIFPYSKSLNLPATFNLFKVIKFLKKIDFTNGYIINFHGAWTFHIMLAFINFSTPKIIHPHGSFDCMGLKKSSIKKIIAKFLYVKRCYQKCDCVCVATMDEAKDVLRFGINNVPIAIIPNSINFNEKLDLDIAKKNEFLKISNSRKIILSLSRLHPSKGIEMLIDAFYFCNFTNAVLFIAGDGDKSFTKILKNKIISLNLQNSVFLLGDLRGGSKNSAYDVADVFVLPSFNENFGITILESYRQKTPVITTTATPFDEIKEYNFGWYIQPSANSLKEALGNALSKSDSELKEFGEKGYCCMKEKYSTESFEFSYKQLYDWLLGINKIPNFVFKPEDINR